MRILIYEYTTGGGLWHDAVDRTECQSLLPEGRAMVASVVADVLAIPNSAGPLGTATRRPAYEPICFRDTRLDWRPPPAATVVTIGSAQEELDQLAHWAAHADATVLIAPELNGRLYERCRCAEQAGGRLLSPHAEFVSLASNKTRTVEHLRKRGVPVPDGQSVLPGAPLPHEFPYPAVLKPIDGAGSLDTRLLTDPSQALDLDDRSRCEYRLEHFCPGMAASVAALGDGSGNYELLSPCRQHISDDGHLQYLGGSLPLAPDLARRASRLAESALAALPPTRGYVGVDMVLGAAADGTQDVVLEINPRLTTAYVGLRRAAATNLADCMIRRASGGPLDVPIQFRSPPIQFDTVGNVTTNSTLTIPMKTQRHRGHRKSC